MAEISNLDIRITASADEAARALDRLTSAANNLHGAAGRAAGGMQNMAGGARDMGTATQNAGTQSGRARSNIRGVGRDAQDAGENAKKGASGLSTFWQSLKRIAYYRMIRSIIKAIGQAFKEGAQNLYQWSNATGLSDFKKNMDRIATSALYLKNSLGAMLEPIVRILTPIIEWVVDKLTWLIDKITQFFAALTGASTYTAAKKVATTWGEAAQDTASAVSGSARQMADDIKRTILGFDEINKLDKPDTGSSGGSGGSGGSGSNNNSLVNDMFEERELDGWAKAISDFVNKLKEWVQPILDFFDTVGDKIKHLWDGFVDGAKDFFSDPLDWLKKHVADPITTGLRKLFGINSPSTEMRTIGTYLIQGLKEGMLDELEGIDNWIKNNIVEPIRSAFSNSNISLYFSPKLDNQGSVLYNNFKNEWDEAGSKILYFSPKFDNTAKVLYDNFKDDWDKSGSKTLYFSPKLDNTAKTLYDNFKGDWDALGSKSLYFSPKMDNTAATLYNNFKNDWDAAGSKTLYVSPKLDNEASVLWNAFKTAWNNLTRTLYVSPKLDNEASVLWNQFKTAWNDLTRTLYASLKLDNKASALWSAFKDEWDNVTQRTAYFNVDILQTAQALWNSLKTAWDAIASRTLYASPKLDNTAAVLWSQFKTAWDAAKSNLTVSVELDYGDGFGGATGGGGSSSGGGAGRDKINVAPVIDYESWQTEWDKFAGHPFEVNVTPPAPEKSKTIFETWWDTFKKVTKFEADVYGKAVNASGEAITAIDKWLFHGANAEGMSVNVKANLTGGTGISSIGSGGKINLVGVNGASAKINATKGTGISKFDDKGNIVLNGVNATSAKINATNGTGISGFDDKGKIKLNGINGVSAKINATAGTGISKVGDTITLKPFGAASTKVNASAGTGLYLSGNSFRLWDTDLGAAELDVQVGDNSSDLAKKVLKDGSFSKRVELGVDVTGLAGASGFAESYFGSADLKETSASLGNIITSFNKIKDGAKKKITINVATGSKPDALTSNALTYQSGAKKTMTIDVGGKSSSDTVKNALNAPATDNKVISVGIGTNQSKSDTAAVNVFDTLGKAITRTVNVAFKALTSTGSNKLVDWLKTFFKTKALGGVFSNGAWGNIPQYAGGTTNAHGSLFLAGEAGPEIVGHVGGRTEVLNKSQLASAMYSAVSNAMRGVTLDANFYGSTDDVADYDTMYKAMYDAFSAVMARGEERDREKVALLRSINEKDYNPEITASSIARGMTRMNRRAGTTVVPTGT